MSSAPRTHATTDRKASAASAASAGASLRALFHARRTQPPSSQQPVPAVVAAAADSFDGVALARSATADTTATADTIATRVSRDDELAAAYSSGKLGLIDGRPISQDTRRRCEMADLFFLEYYCSHLHYVQDRSLRAAEFHSRPIVPTQPLPRVACLADVVVRRRSDASLVAHRPNSASDVVQGTTNSVAPEAADEQLVTMPSESYASVEDKELAWREFLTQESTVLRRRRARVGVANFSVVRQVGQGGFGQVFLARKNDTKELVALKRMGKRVLRAMGEVQHILTERDILTRTASDWLVKLLYSFQDQQNVYLAMEYVPGGDMRTLLNNSGCLREPHARFYISEMIAAVSTLHSLGFIHRDLKPENFLVDRAGHLKLTDFGLSRGKLTREISNRLKARLEKIKRATLMPYSTVERRSIRKSLRREDLMAHSLVGSPDYMAPEILTAADSGEGYSAPIDYWALGCIMFELLCGYPPFTAPTTDEIWVNVYHWHKVLERPIYEGVDEEFNISDDAWDAITSLIADARDRFSSISQIQTLHFFRDVDFLSLRTDPNVRPPFVPSLSSATDTSHFDDFSNPEDVEMYKEVQDRLLQLQAPSIDDSATTASAEENLRKLFVGFTFKHKQQPQQQQQQQQQPQ